MAFKMKGFSGFKQTSYGGFSDVSKSVADAGDITKDPTTEGTLDLAGQTTTTDKDGKEITTQGSQNILKEGQHKADRVANFGKRVSNVAKAAKSKAEEGGKKADATDKTAETDVTQDKVEIDPKTNGDKDTSENKVELSDENKEAISKQGNKWVSDIMGSFT